MKNIVVISLFPDLLKTICSTSILKRAQADQHLELFFINLRDFSEDKHRSVDAPPAGGGEGMLLRVDVLYRAWESAVKTLSEKTPIKPHTLYLSPQGKVLTQEAVMSFGENRETPLILVCGHYEGVDERFIELCVNEEISIGDYVLTGGELPAAVLLDALVRWIPGVLGNENSAKNDSLSPNEKNGKKLLKYPQYTKPVEFMGKQIPDILSSGHHGKIEKWRDEKRIEVTFKKRPDLLK